MLSENKLDKGILTAFVLSILGIAYTILELILLYHHTSICTSQGCKFVSSFAVFGENTVIWLGTAYFILLSLSLWFRYRYVLLTTLGLTAEGYLLAFQLFIVHTICYFCLGIFSLIFIISLVLLFNKKMSLTKYLYPLTIFLMVYLIRIPYVSLSQNNNYLFYSPTCPHCHQTIAYLKQHKVNIKLINANDYKAFLNSFGIDQIPCLVAKNKVGNINIVVGENEIEKYLVSNNKNNAAVSESNRKINQSLKEDLKEMNYIHSELIKSNQKQKTLPHKNKGVSTLKSRDNNTKVTTNGFYNSTKNYGIPQTNNSQACTIGNDHCH
jgi:glutaredoxin